MHLINAGYGEAPALELIARETPEPRPQGCTAWPPPPAAASTCKGAARPGQRAPHAAPGRGGAQRCPRQMSLVVPNLVFMAPVLFVFLLAPLPQLLFGK